jgi:hypothetical protein
MTHALIFPAIIVAYLLARFTIGYFDNGSDND